MDESRRAEFLAQYNSAEPAIRAHVRRLVPLRSDVDDVLQEVAVVLWKKFPQFRPEDDFRRWAFGVAKYEVLAWYRDRGRDRTMLSGAMVEILADDAILEDSRLHAQQELLDRCMGKLDPRDRQLILASYRPAARIQDVAVQSGRSVGGFYQWLHRMRKTLLDCIRAEMQRSEKA